MWRVAPLPPAVASSESTTLIAALRAENASLVESLATLHVRFDALQRENRLLLEHAGESSSSPRGGVVLSLCERVAEMTAHEERLRRKLRTLHRRLQEQQQQHDLSEQVHQLRAGMEELQKANHSKATELCRIKRDIARIKEHLTCSITQDIMQTPCILSTGQMYNRSSIVDWLRRSDDHRCPNTNRGVQWFDHAPAICPALSEVCAIVARMS